MSHDPARPANRLAGETSAYLRQHMHNPVDWYPWGEQALARARAEDRPLLVSIGYSACHWCHVMERESFEDEETAALHEPALRQREGRSRGASRRRSASTWIPSFALTGHGGWPLTVFCTPDGPALLRRHLLPAARRATGCPRSAQVLEAVAQAWRDAPRRGEAERGADPRRARASGPRGVAERAARRAHARGGGASACCASADLEHGGFGDAPKFPTPTNLDAAARGLRRAARREGAGRPRPRRAHVPRDGAPRPLRSARRRLPSLLRRRAAGPSRTSRRCSTTRASSCASTPRRGAARARATTIWSGRSRETLGLPAPRDDARRTAASSRARMPTARARKASTTSGRRTRSRPCSAPSAGADFCAAYGVTPRGNFEHGTTQLVDVARGAARASFAARARALLDARSQRVPPGHRSQARRGLECARDLGPRARRRACSATTRCSRMPSRAADFVLRTHARRQGAARARLRRRTARTYRPFSTTTPALLERLSRSPPRRRRRALPRRPRSASPNEIVARFYDETEADLFLTPADGERLVHRPRAEHDGAMPDATGQAVLGLLRGGDSRRATLRSKGSRSACCEPRLRARARAACLPVSRARAALADGALVVAVIVGEPESPQTQALAARSRRVLGPEDAVLVCAPGKTVPRRRSELARGPRPRAGTRRRLRLSRHELLASDHRSRSQIQSLLSHSIGSGNGPS